MQYKTEFGTVNIDIEFNESVSFPDKKYIKKNIQVSIENLDWMYKKAINLKEKDKQKKENK